MSEREITPGQVFGFMVFGIFGVMMLTGLIISPMEWSDKKTCIRILDERDVRDLSRDDCHTAWSRENRVYPMLRARGDSAVADEIHKSMMLDSEPPRMNPPKARSIDEGNPAAQAEPASPVNSNKNNPPSPGRGSK